MSIARLQIRASYDSAITEGNPTLIFTSMVRSKSTLERNNSIQDVTRQIVSLPGDLLAAGTFRMAPAFTARLAGSNDGVLAGNELVVLNKDATNNKIQARINATAWSGVTLKISTYKVTA